MGFSRATLRLLALYKPLYSANYRSVALKPMQSLIHNVCLLFFYSKFLPIILAILLVSIILKTMPA